MKNLTNKVTSAIFGVVLFAAACVMAGLGFAVVATLAMFAFVAVGITLLSAPFVAVAQPTEDSTIDAEATV